MFLKGGACQHRNDPARERADTEAPPDRRRIRLLALQEALQHGVVHLDHRLDQRLAAGLGLGLHLGGHFVAREFRAESLRLPDDGLHRNQVDDPDMVRLGADGQLDRHRIGAEPLANHRDAAAEIGAHPVHLVDEADARHVVLVGLAPDCLRLRLDAGDRIEHRDGAVEHPQRALHLDREVDVAGACR